MGGQGGGQARGQDAEAAGRLAGDYAALGRRPVLLAQEDQRHHVDEPRGRGLDPGGRLREDQKGRGREGVEAAC
tara:strand:+ start:7900 stop:8121 length:222 start_codon:yes stop_codon:yes gene_type:complete